MNETKLRQIIDDFKDHPSFDFEGYGEKFDDVAISLLKFLLFSTLVEREEIDIGTYQFKNKNGKRIESVQIAYDIYDTDKMLNFRLTGKSVYEIHLCYYDYNIDKFRNYKYKLNKEEIADLPLGLINLMTEVQKTKEEKTVSSKTIVDKNS